MSISEKATEFAGLGVIDYQPGAGLVLTAMPRRVFRLGEGMAEKFWAVSLGGSRLTIQSRHAGAAWDSGTQVLPGAAAARAGYGNLVASIVKDGYAEQKQSGGSTREAIFQALEADPDDHVSRMALADYLSEHGEQLPAAAYRVEEAGYGQEGYGTIANL